jgi:hypothetical protein
MLIMQATRGQAAAAQLCLTLSARQLEALASGLQACSDALRQESVSSGVHFGSSSGRSGRQANRATWLADQSRALAEQVSQAHSHSVHLTQASQKACQPATAKLAGLGVAKGCCSCNRYFGI